MESEVKFSYYIIRNYDGHYNTSKKGVKQTIKLNLVEICH